MAGLAAVSSRSAVVWQQVGSSRAQLSIARKCAACGNEKQNDAKRKPSKFTTVLNAVAREAEQRLEGVANSGEHRT